MSEDVFDLTGPLSESIKLLDENQLKTFNVQIRPESNNSTVHPLNPVGQLRRAISLGHNDCTEALLVLSNQFLEVYTIVSESSQQSTHPEKQSHAGNFARKLKHVASTGASHVRPILRRKESHAPDDESLEASEAEQMDKMTGLFKDHILSIGVAFSQVLKMRLRGSEITIYYQPNGMKPSRYGKLLAGAMRFSCSTHNQQDALRLMEAAQNSINRINQAAVFLRTEMVLPSELHIFAVTRQISGQQAGSDKDEELVLAKDPPWGSFVATPDWGQDADLSQQPIWVYMSTPLGYGKAEIAPRIVSKYLKDGHASFYVGVKHPQAQSLAFATVSRLQRVSTYTREHEADDDDEDSDESWQPEHSAESVSSPSTASSPGTINRRLSNPNGRTSLANGRNGQHIRLHCSATYIDNPCKYQGPPSHSAASKQTSLGKGPLPDLLQDNRNTVLAALAVLFLVFWLIGYKQVALLSANLAFAIFTFSRGQHSSSDQKVSAPVLSTKSDCGEWKVVLVRAELIKDEPFSEYGSSMAAKIEADDSEESVGGRKAELCKQFAMTTDEVDRYFLAFPNDEALAHRKMAATHAWRKENGALNILKQPAPNFRFFKEMFHHAVLGTTKDGHPIWYMKVGDMKTGFKSYKHSNLTSKDLARHVALCMDYMYHMVENEPLPNGRALWVMDLKGMGLTDIGSEAFDLGKEIAGLIRDHWPERLYRAFVINMPGFFSVLWKLIEPMMAASTRRKIRLLRGKDNTIKELTEELNLDEIPVEYGGQLDNVYHAESERGLWEYVQTLE